ncbi:carboxypeptidase regulatory-like domain-containing protein [Nocardioides sp. KIGAM211]|uniref:Carboxypeptidase regulatory-like domain-containing protein n=1 Tax=Nocardioides luti TaxID=2761101 RepID=A0A7X0RJZ4_9ACTN|nr:carboxypeptidase-like regulatory domain-containing protein [Nocardioides luti]MBB6628670.1 carboxypeptidase regulatory-like domain-containing protein [Nocardioides luti]
MSVAQPGPPSGTTRRTGLPLTAALVVLGLVAALLLALAPAPAAHGAETGKVRGQIVDTRGPVSKVRMLWFTKDWTYLGARKVSGGGYSLSLRPGTYWLQFVDLRPAYDITKNAPENIKVTIRAGHTSVGNVRMHRGAAITGTVRAGGKVASGARVVAANTAKQSFEVRANKEGQFALGGLPNGKYSVFTYDRTKRWVGRSTYAGSMARGDVTNLAIALTKHAGGLLVDLYAGSEPINSRVTATVVSRKTGQFWTARSNHGSISFQGLFPGRYTLIMPGAGNFIGRTGPVSHGRVKPGRVAFGSFRLTQRGATVSGIVVDGEDEGYGLEKAQVLLFDQSGTKIAETSTNSEGQFFLTTRLTSQGGMVVVVNPDPNAGGWVQSSNGYCKFLKGMTDAFSITTSDNEDVGAIPLAHAPADEQDGAIQCYPSDGS